MKFIRILSLCCAGGALAATGASAGGYIAPVTEVDVVAAPLPAPVSDWAGAYGGVSLGYSFAGDDEVGLEFYEGDDLVDRQTDVGDVELSGPTADLHAGYRWQRNMWVFGPELAIEGGKIDDESDILGSDQASVESEVNYIATLAFKTGYLVNPQTMVYGTAGFVHGDFDYTLTGPDGSATEGFNADGYTLGLGVERKVNDRMSVFAEYQYRDFGRTDVTFSDGTDSVVTVATPKHQNIKLGVNFSF